MAAINPPAVEPSSRPGWRSRLPEVAALLNPVAGPEARRGNAIAVRRCGCTRGPSGSPPGEQPPGLGGNLRSREQVALADVAAHQTAPLELSLLFDPYGDNADPKPVREGDDRVASLSRLHLRHAIHAEQNDDQVLLPYLRQR